MSVSVEVDQDLCTACGICYSTCPEVYDSNDDGISVVVEEYRTDGEAVGEVSDDLQDCAQQGEEECPVDAIDVE